jgi:hypothetical protein
MNNGLINRWLGLAIALGTAGLLTGCGEGSNPAPTASTPPPPPPAAAAPVAPAAPAKPAVEAPKPVVAEAPKTVVEEAAKVVQQVAADAGAAAQKQFNDLVAEVKQLVAEGKGPEAWAKLQSAVSGLKLTGDQQGTLDALKKQVQESASQKGVEAATKAVGDFFKPKPAPAAPAAPATPK